MSEVERLIRAVLNDGARVQVVFEVGGKPQICDLAGVEEGSPRIELKTQTVEMSMDAETLEGRGT